MQRLVALGRWPTATRISAWTRCLSSEVNAVKNDSSNINPEYLPKLKEQKIDELGRSYGTGRRKNAVARVWIWEGSGQITVNGKSFIHYFQPLQRYHILESFLSSQTHGLFDVWCTVKGNHFNIHVAFFMFNTFSCCFCLFNSLILFQIKGGGISGQAGAVRLGISRAMELYEPTLRPQLREDGMLTRDRRRVERKKPGQKKARKKFQWVKR